MTRVPLARPPDPIFLNCSAPVAAERLGLLLTHHRPPREPFNGGTVHYHPADVEARPRTGGFTLTIRAELISGDYPRAYRVRPMSPAIICLIDPLAAGRCEVAIIPMHGVTEAAMSGLVASIRARWPEAVPATDTDGLLAWQREAVRMWNEGRTAPQIASTLGKDEQTISNLWTDLRKRHPGLVPYRNSRVTPK